jgi:beta-lactam-binding protein with PASTA domain/tRNA A-37 threonylcarbamoyl transferase component Bud32
MVSGAADLTGRVLSSRYRLLAPIGTGASGRVYVADDVRLRRRVAVKVLHAALADDAGFLRRFRVEAQMAASLHHANIMAVYDWGEDGEVPFMVLELLAGGSLRGMLDSGARLTPSQAVNVGRQAAAALAYAHARGLVHRDVKPANLLFDEHGILRVADFGLARALAEASWTEPVGAVVGTARYAAPEQATGAALDGRADLYALAVVLVESVTGQVPDLAETAIGTLAARTQRPLAAPLELGRLGPVIERAGRPDPTERYPDAATMGAALDDTARALPPPEPLQLAGLSGAAADARDPTQLRHSARLFDQDATVGASTGPAAGAEQSTAVSAATGRRSRPPGSHRLVPAVVALVLLAALGAAGVALVGSPGNSVTVPSLVGLRSDAATKALSGKGLSIKIIERSADDPKDLVIGQDPAPGSFVASGGEVQVIVSRGPPPVAVPDVSGRSVDDATAVLQQAGFAVSTDNRNDENVPKGNVVGTDPAQGTSVAPGSTVTIIVSAGPAPVAVPDVAGKSYDDAVQALAAKRFTAVRRDDFSSTVPSGKAIGTDPAAGQLAPRDSQVTVIMSKGPEMVTVPNLRGDTLDVATQQLQALGLQIDTSGYLIGRTVRAQDPPAGTSVPKGTTVTLFF